jgi:hypothetical protein
MVKGALRCLKLGGGGGGWQWGMDVDNMYTQ